MHLKRARVAACGAVARQDDAKAKEEPGAGKTDKQKANAVPGESSPAARVERWSGLNRGIPDAHR